MQLRWSCGAHSSSLVRVYECVFSPALWVSSLPLRHASIMEKMDINVHSRQIKKALHSLDKLLVQVRGENGRIEEMIVEEEEVRREEGVAGRVAVAMARAQHQLVHRSLSPAILGAACALCWARGYPPLFCLNGLSHSACICCIYSHTMTLCAFTHACNIMRLNKSTPVSTPHIRTLMDNHSPTVPKI